MKIPLPERQAAALARWLEEKVQDHEQGTGTDHLYQAMHGVIRHVRKVQRQQSARVLPAKRNERRAEIHKQLNRNRVDLIRMAKEVWERYADETRDDREWADLPRNLRDQLIAEAKKAQAEIGGSDGGERRDGDRKRGVRAVDATRGQGSHGADEGLRDEAPLRCQSSRR